MTSHNWLNVINELNPDRGHVVLCWHETRTVFDLEWLKSRLVPVLMTVMQTIENYGYKRLPAWDAEHSKPDWYHEDIALVTDLCLLYHDDDPYAFNDDFDSFNQAFDAVLEAFRHDDGTFITETVTALTETIEAADDAWLCKKAENVKGQLEELLARKACELETEER